LYPRRIGGIDKNDDTAPNGENPENSHHSDLSYGNLLLRSWLQKQIDVQTSCCIIIFVSLCKRFSPKQWIHVDIAANRRVASKEILHILSAICTGPDNSFAASHFRNVI
jgi:hypothetical protein